MRHLRNYLEHMAREFYWFREQYIKSKLRSKQHQLLTEHTSRHGIQGKHLEALISFTILKNNSGNIYFNSPELVEQTRLMNSTLTIISV